MELNELKAVIEALIFVSEEPITDRQLLEILSETGATKEDVDAALTAIAGETTPNQERGLQLVEVAGGYQFRTKENCAPWIAKMSVPKPVRLSQPALETLSIIAYRQPIVRSEIEAIRGVDVGAVLKTLLERNLVRIIGRRDEPGQPLIYGTTQEFLELFGLKSLSELPALTDIEELARRQVETQSPPALSLVKGGEDEEPTEIVDYDEDDEEEETEIVKKEEEEDEGEEMLGKIEQSMKDLRRMEKEIFPKKKEDGSAQSTQPAPEDTPDSSVPDASAEDDRPDQ